MIKNKQTTTHFQRQKNNIKKNCLYIKTNTKEKEAIFKHKIYICLQEKYGIFQLKWSPIYEFVIIIQFNNSLNLPMDPIVIITLVTINNGPNAKPYQTTDAAPT